jgi:hypothetical protein
MSAENTRAKVHQGVLPSGMPVKIAVLFGVRPSLQCVRRTPGQGRDSV